MTYLEESKTRLTLVVDHAHGAASLNKGWLEVMFDKKAMVDDGRGMGEGVLDNLDTTHRLFTNKINTHFVYVKASLFPPRYWLLLEERKTRPEVDELSLPSQV